VKQFKHTRGDIKNRIYAISYISLHSNWIFHYLSIIGHLYTSWCRVLLEKLTGLQLVKKFPAFHGTRRFINAPRSVRHLGQPNLVHIPTSHLLEIHPNTIHPSTPRSPQLSPSLRFPQQDPIHPPSPHPYAPHAQPISFFSNYRALVIQLKYVFFHWLPSTN